ncbi:MULTISPECIES: hypothetical protein [unclassified Maridesulfovibrio]|uniref:hypothetical protein n=1 Tax=unclassified Maridesulfovibrio TaxID=2794999 RepID=UPI003B3E716C
MPDFPLVHDQLVQDDPGLNFIMSVDLSSIMLFPSPEDLTRLGHYRARCLLKAVPFLIEQCEYKERYIDGVLMTLAEDMYGTWENFTLFVFPESKNIIPDNFLDSAIQKGRIAGMIFQRVMYENMGISEAASDIISRANDIEMIGEYGGDVKNIVNNIWRPRKIVAHWWAALLNFEVTNRGKDYMALDTLVPKDRKSCLKNGLVGFVSVVNQYYSEAVERGVVYKRSRRKLIDPDKAWRIVLV